MGAIVVAVLLGGLGMYVLFHSPLGDWLGRALGARLECTWWCAPLRPMAESVAAVIAIAAALLGAWGVTVRSGIQGSERLVAGGLVAYALLTVPAAVIAGAGDRIGQTLLTPPVGPLLVAIPGAVAFVAGLRGRPRLGAGLALDVRIRRPAPLVAVLSAVVVVLLVVSAGLAISYPPVGYDELGYHLTLAVMLWRTGSLSIPLERLPDSFSMAHPGSTELWFGLLHQIGGEPLMVLGQLPFAVVGAVAIAVLGRHAGLPSRAAAIGGLVFLSVPIVVIGIGRGANDVVAAAVVTGIAALLTAPEPRWTTTRIVIIGLALGVLAVTKLAVLPAVAALGAVLLWTVLRPRSAIPRVLGRRGLAVGALLGFVAVAPWWMRNLEAFGNPLYPAVLPGLGQGVSQPLMGMMDMSHVPAPWLWPLYPWISPNVHNLGFGALFAVMLVPGLALAVRSADRRVLGPIALVALLSVIPWWTQTRHEPRFLLGVAALACALLPFAVVGLGRRWMRLGAGVLMVAAVASGVITLATGLGTITRAPVDRDEFYARAGGVKSALRALPTPAGLLLDDLCPGTRAFIRTYPLLAADGKRSIARVPCGASLKEVLATMDRYGLRFVLAVERSSDAPDLDARYPSDRFDLVWASVRQRTGGRAPTLMRVYERRPEGSREP